MEGPDEHQISIKFLSALIMGLLFAFLLVYVFIPHPREYYPAYEVERENIASAGEVQVLEKDLEALLAEQEQEHQRFREDFRNRSLQLMESAKESSLAVITSRGLERMDGLREEMLRDLDQLQAELEARESSLMREKRRELEANLSSELQAMRREIREKYSDYNQRQIKNNYLRILNLRLAIDKVAESDSERRPHQEELEQVLAEQQELMSERSQQENMDISARTQTLILEFNQEYYSFRQEIRDEHNEILAEEEEEMLAELERIRAEIRAEMEREREDKAARIEALIEESLEKYY
ncbi:hypothetical protein [Halanaerobium hydrogeniformans]|uniref:Uncharacterized protein n=1 Tax=Halanaerobium hydrogeniformans TaxID=656519 RepID=E4RP66_HALHG|nr:hypothetical protein [Halanaerobium hydrogeniformans]ADQ13891.1 hypothetical protein Halsa_0416 [Halanaerobium hydrogeniformans]